MIKMIFLNTPFFLFFAIAFSLSLKIVLLSTLVKQFFRSLSTQKICFFLLLVLLGSMVGEFAWLIKLINVFYSEIIPLSVILFLIRLSWGFLIIEYQSLVFFIKCLSQKNFNIIKTDFLTLILSGLFTLYFIFMSVFGLYFFETRKENLQTITDLTIKNYFEISMMRVVVFYIFVCLIIPTLYFIVKKIQSNTLPKILKQQLQIIFKYLFLPFFFIEILIAFTLTSLGSRSYICAVVGLSAMLFTFIIYYCLTHIMGMRFLNFSNHIQAPVHYNFINDFKYVLEQLSLISSQSELIHVTQDFFYDAFTIAPCSVALQMRNFSGQSSSIVEMDIESFYSQQNEGLLNYIINAKILIYDEIQFSNFYQEDKTRTQIVAFLDRINADIFLPILDKQKIIAYIIVSRNAFAHKLYTNMHRDQMIVFSSYLGNIINLIQNRNLESIIQQGKELQEELYHKQKELEHYKESMRSFLKRSSGAIGIIFYKNRHFTLANHIAKEMIKINLNHQDGHPLTQSLKEVIRHVQEYGKAKTIIAKDFEGNQLILTGFAHLEKNSIIITVTHPDISDIVTKHWGVLKDPSRWDYVLYLETTNAGRLINQLIPSDSPTFLEFKLTLLHLALTKKALLLENMQPDDLMHIVEILHYISNRSILEIVSLTTHDQLFEIAARLFGVNSLYSKKTNVSGQIPLLEKLDKDGTLFIQNIEYLHAELQSSLAQYLKRGYFYPYKQDHKKISSARIICSSNSCLTDLVEKNLFDKELFFELKKCSLVLPALNNIPQEELVDLVKGLSGQFIKTEDLMHLLTLNEKEQNRLLQNPPLSLYELKMRLRNLLLNKTKKHTIETHINVETFDQVIDPELIQARKLGKHALKDPKIMTNLWNKLKNQNKIATLLGVNRSSVNRRFKSHNLQIH